MVKPAALPRSSVHRYLILIILLALTLRVLLALALGEELREVSGTFDQIAYDLLGQRVSAGYGFSFPTTWYLFARANEPTAHWSFLYTLYLAAIYSIFGHHPLAARLIQVLLSGLNLLLVYRLGQRLFGTSAGLAAAALTALYAYLILFNASLMTQTFYILSVLASLELALSVVQQPKWGKWFLLGASLGLGILLRQSLLLFTPLLLGWIWWRFSSLRSLSNKRAWLGMLLALGVIASLILPWTTRNYLIYHDFLLLNSNGGYWFYSSNHPDQGIKFDPNFKAPIAENLLTLSEPAIDRTLFREGVNFVISNPSRFLLLSISRINNYFWVLPSGDSTALGNWSRLFSFGLYLPFMILGLYLSRAQWRLCLPLYLYVAFDSTFCLLSWAAPRYRLPSDAVMMVFAGLAVSTLVARLHLTRPLAFRAG